MRELHAIISGKVQGVNFRSFVMEEASALDIRGWVHNTEQGDLEIVAQADEQVLKEFLDAIHEGPRLAHVVTIRTQWREAEQEYSEFSVT